MPCKHDTASRFITDRPIVVRQVSDDETQTAGTDQEEDASMVGSEPDPAAVEEPTESSEQAASGSKWMVKKLVSVGLVSITGTLLLVIGLALLTGLFTLPAGVPSGPVAYWSVFLFLGLLLLTVFAWTQRGT